MNYLIFMKQEVGQERDSLTDPYRFFPIMWILKKYLSTAMPSGGFDFFQG